MPKVEREEDPQEDVELEQDAELKAVHFSTTMNGMRIPLWTSYCDWLRLMVVHFDAVNILVSYVAQPNFDRNISIKILVAPPVDDALLLWKDLFNDPKLFPTIDRPLSKTDNEILFFLEKATSSNPKHSLEFANAALASWGKQDVPNTIKNIKELQDSTLPGWHHSVVTLLTLLDVPPYPTSSDDCTIFNKIQSLCDGATFFNSLNS